jgi:LCP family protein required for cell wall assembly
MRRVPAILLAIGLALVIASGGTTIGGLIVLKRFDSAIGRGNLLDPGARAGGQVSGPLNFILVGSDRRVGNPSSGARSDTIIIAHVTRALDHAYLISVPRDLVVAIPPGEGYQGGKTKINAAIEMGQGGANGVRVLSRTLTDLVGVQFAGAAVVEFSGLTKAVDLVGGVQMCVDTRTVSIHTHRVFETGCRHMNSDEVLDYLRQRDYPDGDYTRQRHQQQFLKAFLSKASASVSTPAQLNNLMKAVGSALTVDTDGRPLSDLLYGLRGIGPDRLTGVRIPSTPVDWEGESAVAETGDAKGLYAALQSDHIDAWCAAHSEWVNSL